MLHGEAGTVSYTCGLLFYHQYGMDLSVSEGVEQSYLLCDSVVDEGCEGVAYDDFGITYGDTIEEGVYLAKKYIHEARYGYDSLFVHRYRVYPSSVVFDTLLLEVGNLGGLSVGASVDTLYSIHGCDSLVFRMVYAVVCPDNEISVAPYGVAEVPFSPVEPSVAPLMEGVSALSDAPPLLTVGTSEHISWLLTAGNDTFRCEQDVLVDFPPCGGTFTATDGDGNLYETVRVGADCWLKQNVHATHYAGSGDTIPVASVFNAASFPDTIIDVQQYGRLYSWYSAVGVPENSSLPPSVNAEGKVQGVCPVGWHVPSSAELSSLRQYEGAELKAVGDFWIGDPPTDESHFSMLPGGMYNAVLHRYESLRAYAYLWLSDAETPTVASAAYLRYLCSELDITYFGKTNGCSVRCAKD